MSPRMSQGAALVLLLAMMLAMAVGMMAWGPIELLPSDHRFADLRVWLGLPQAFNALACVPLVVVCALGIVGMQRSRWPMALRTPCMGFFTLAALMSLSAIAYHLEPSDAGYVLGHAFAAGAMTMLGLAFMAERIDTLFGSAPAVLGAMSVVGFATLWWFAGNWATGHGDLRALVFLQSLPLLLIPAGALSLQGRFTRGGDWLVMLSLYLLARSADLADQRLFDATGVGGHALMHLLLAAVAGCIAYRAGVVPGDKRSAAPSLSEPTQRRTSLNTSS